MPREHDICTAYATATSSWEVSPATYLVPLQSSAPHIPLRTEAIKDRWDSLNMRKVVF